MTDVPETTRRAVRAYEHASERLAERGVSDAENGRAMVAAGLSRWSRAVSPDQLVEELAKLVGGLAAVTGVDLNADPKPDSTAH